MPDVEESQPAQPPLNRLEVLRGLHISTWEGIWATVHGVLTGGAFQTGFALLLGASPFALGLMAGLPSAVGLIQLPASVYSERRGNRRQFVAAVAFPGRILWALILLIPFVLPRDIQFPTFLTLMTISAALVSAGSPAWTSWMSDLVPTESRGQYFARRNTLMGLFTMLVPLPAGAFLDQAVKFHRFDPKLGFAVLFMLGCAGAVGSLLLILRQPEPPARRNPKAQSPLKSLAAPLANANFRNFLIFSSVIGLGQTIAGPFFTAWQLDSRYLALPYLAVQILGAVASLAGLLATPIWGYLSDKYGSRPVVALSNAGVIIAPIFWLFTIPGTQAFWINAALIVVLNLFSGAFWAGVGLAQFNLLLQIAPPTGRATYTAVYSAVTGVVAGLSPVLGGTLIAMWSGVHIPLGSVDLNNYKILFLLASLIRVACLFLVGRVAEPEGKSTRYVLEQLASARPVSSFRNLRRLSAPAGEGERLRAVDRLGDIRSPLAVEELTLALDDVSPDVRESAAQALGSIGDARALPALIAKLNDPAAGIGELAAEALGRIGDPSAADALAASTLGPDARVRVAALKALGRLPSAVGHPAVTEAIRASLQPTHPTACEAACAALTMLGPAVPKESARATLPRLLALLSPDIDRGMRLAAARALESLGPQVAREPGIFETLRARIADESDPAVLAQEADTLSEIGHRAGIGAEPLLVTLLPILAHPAVEGLAYKQALEALADVGLTPGVFYPYLSMNEMARDQAFHRLIGEIGRKMRPSDSHGSSSFSATDVLESYSSGDYEGCLMRLAAPARNRDDSPAALTLRSLNATASDRSIRPDETLLAALLLRESQIK